MYILKSIQIDCKKEELWSWLTEFEKLKKWNKTIIKEEHITQDEVKIDYKTKVLIREGNRETWYNNEIMAYRPYELLRIALSGGTLGTNPMIVEYVITKKNNQLKLTLESKWKPSGFMLKLFYPLIKIKATKNTLEVLQELKNQIENRQQ